MGAKKKDLGVLLPDAICNILKAVVYRKEAFDKTVFCKICNNIHVHPIIPEEKNA